MQKWAKQKVLHLGGIFNSDIVFPDHNANHLREFSKLKSETCEKKDLNGESDYC